MVYLQHGMWHPYTKFWLWPGAAVGGVCTEEGNRRENIVHSQMRNNASKLNAILF